MIYRFFNKVEIIALEQMTLTVAEIERISKEIREYYRVESVNQSIQKIRSNFYEEVKEALETLNEMAKESVSQSKIENYRKIMDKKEMMEKSLHNFLLKRYDKLMRDSLFEISSKTYEPLAPSEKRFIMEMHNHMAAIFDNIEKPQEHAEVTPVKKPEEKIEEKKEPEKVKEEIEMIPLTFLADYLPVATSIGDFYLHKSDIVYLPAEIADLLLTRKYVRKIQEMGA